MKEKECQELSGESLNSAVELKNKLYALMPEIFTEGVDGQIDWEKLKLALGEEMIASNERYVLNWAGKSDAFRIMQKPSSRTLVACRQESVDFDQTEHIFIEGENLEVLKVLEKSYFGKIKMIYIDPPYNTGNDSFIYPDKFAESKEDYLKRVGDKNEEGFLTKEGLFRKNSKENGHYHSNWLSMMYPRLFLARNLLKDDGVIFVSIDDNEVHNLRMILNEIFGEENFVANIVWQKKYAATNDAKGFSPMHDHILVFQKTELFQRKLLPRTEKQNKLYKYDDGDGKGFWRSDNLLVKSFSESGVFPIVNSKTGKEYFPPKGSCWRGSKETIERWLKEERIFFGKDGTGAPQLKRYLNEVQDGCVPTTWWTFEEVGHNDAANKELKNLFQSKAPFDTPKPSSLLKHMLMIATNPDDIILDFFSGSGTLAHAVLELNREDSGSRKFICVQLAQPCDVKSEAYKAGYLTIADIAKERIRRVIQKIKQEQSEKLELSENNLDLGFKAFRLADSNFKQWRLRPQNEAELTDQLELTVDAVCPNAPEESMLIELLLKSGFSLNSRVQKKDSFYLIEEGKLVIIFEKVTQETFDAVIKLSPVKVIVLDRIFENNDALKTNIALQFKDAGIVFKTV